MRLDARIHGLLLLAAILAIGCGQTTGPGGGSGIDLQISNPGNPPYNSGTFEVRSPRFTVTRDLRPAVTSFLYFGKHDMRAGDVLTVTVRPSGAAPTTQACTVAARGVQLTYVGIWLGQDPETAAPGGVFCECGTQEFAGTNDPNRCRP